MRTDKAIDTPYVNHQALSDMDAQIQKDCQSPILPEIPNINGTTDSSVSVHGMPVSLQLVGRKLKEESLLAMTGLVLKAITP